MPARKAPAQKVVRFPSRLRRQQRQQRFILGSGVAAIILVLALLGVGYYYDRFAPAGEPVLLVNGTPVTATQLVAWARLLGQGTLRATEPVALVTATMGEVQGYQIIRQKAPGLGVSLTPQEVEDALRRSLDPEADFDQAYPRRLQELGVSDAQYRDFIAARALQRKVLDHFAAPLPQGTEQVHLYALMVTDEAKAKEIKGRAEAGEDFSALAREFSQDVNLKNQGGDLGWVPRGVYLDFDEPAFSLPVGGVSDPVPLPGSFFLLKVAERGVRPLEPAQREQLAAAEFRAWFLKQQEASQVENRLDQRRLNWVVRRLGRAGSRAGLPVK